MATFQGVNLMTPRSRALRQLSKPCSFNCGCHFPVELLDKSREKNNNGLGQLGNDVESWVPRGRISMGDLHKYTQHNLRQTGGQEHYKCIELLTPTCPDDDVYALTA